MPGSNFGIFLYGEFKNLEFSNFKSKASCDTYFCWAHVIIGAPFPQHSCSCVKLTTWLAYYTYNVSALKPGTTLLWFLANFLLKWSCANLLSHPGAIRQLIVSTIGIWSDLWALMLPSGIFLDLSLRSNRKSCYHGWERVIRTFYCCLLPLSGMKCSIVDQSISINHSQHKPICLDIIVFYWFSSWCWGSL